MFIYRTRAFAAGISAAINYIMAFITTKTYYNLEKSLTLFGVITLYAVIDVLGMIFIYFYLPETEKRTLEDIEIHFSDNNKKLTDVKIKKNASQQKLEKLDKLETEKTGCDNNAFEK